MLFPIIKGIVSFCNIVIAITILQVEKSERVRGEKTYPLVFILIIFMLNTYFLWV